jgi:threonine dehydrogenase-like Zn-dependent dehydrogenase
VVIGVGKDNLDFNYTLIQKKELHILGSRNALTQDFEQLILLCSQGKVDLDGIITDIFPFTRTEDAFNRFSMHREDVLKVILDFSC